MRLLLKASSKQNIQGRKQIQIQFLPEFKCSVRQSKDSILIVGHK